MPMPGVEKTRAIKRRLTKHQESLKTEREKKKEMIDSEEPSPMLYDHLPFKLNGIWPTCVVLVPGLSF
ncbi:hypothetical protein FRX31_004380 [Thalictrum thalictroides]|uniref:Uncharacterized protein n=1 Tax=Thalictrum thalictroides TaxID=46969 RepID=A0A7J6X9A9_THATH|nr:hypothetical protein FRX31_004380 [Thalictrum thalictroides]